MTETEMLNLSRRALRNGVAVLVLTLTFFLSTALGMLAHGDRADISLVPLDTDARGGVEWAP